MRVRERERTRQSQTQSQRHRNGERDNERDRDSQQGRVSNFLGKNASHSSISNGKCKSKIR